MQQQGHIADLVQEERPAVALFELSDAAAVGAGERAFFVAEKFAFQQRFRDGGAIDGQEWAIRPLAELVDGSGHQFLSRPALPSNQHGDILRGDQADRFVHFLHCRRTADDHVSIDMQRRGRIERDRFVGHPHDLDSPLDRLFDLRDLQRFGQVIQRAALHGFDGHVAGTAGRDEDDGHFRPEAAHLVVHLEPVFVWQQDIEDYCIRGGVANDLQRLVCVGSRNRFVPHAVDNALQERKIGRFVVDN